MLSHLGVKHIADGDALLVEERSCSWAAIMQNFDDILVL